MMSAPVVVTHAASDITNNSAILHGEITDMGVATEVEAFFAYRKAGTSSWYGTPSQIFSAPTPYSMDMSTFTTLDGSSEYEFFAIVYFDYQGTTYQSTGSILTFTTLEGFAHPSVTTLDATNVEETTVTLNGEVTDMGTCTSVKGMFAYKKTTDESYTLTPEQILTTVGVYSSLVSGLTPNTDYQFFARLVYQDEESETWYFTHGSLRYFTTSLPYQYTYGSGTEEDPYQVWTPDDLDGVREHLSSWFIQKADINLAIEYPNWIPIGGEFVGTYDGGNFLIEGLDVDVVTYGNKEFAGLFRLVNEGTLKNIRVDGTFYGAKYIGALVGLTTLATIDNCYSTGSVIGQERVGGLIGRIQGTVITNSSSSCSVIGEHVDDAYITIAHFGQYGNVYNANCESRTVAGLVGVSGPYSATWSSIDSCYATGNIKCGDSPSELEDYYGAYVGGFVGETFNTTYNKCYASGDVEGSFGVGGFGGIAENVQFSDCFARGSVTPHRDVDLYLHLEDEPSMRLLRALAGFMGKFQEPEFAPVEPYYVRHSYSTGFVHTMTSDANQSGGFTYEPGESVTYENNYYDMETAQQNDSVLAYPRLTAQMVYPYDDKHIGGTYVNWEFEQKYITDLTDYDFIFGDPPIWTHDVLFAVNDGYPIFVWLPMWLQSKCIPFLFKVPYWE